jgi:hypothetical protein
MVPGGRPLPQVKYTRIMSFGRRAAAKVFF